MKKRNYCSAILALCILIITLILAGAMVALATISVYAQNEVAIEEASDITNRPTLNRMIHHRDRSLPDVLDMTQLNEPVSEPEESPLCGEALYQSYVDEIAALYFQDLDTSMVKALIYTESRYQPEVSSSAGAVGLMQVIPYYHAWRMEKYGMSDIWDPYTNILVGMDLLDELYQKYGNWYDVLYFYSGGDASYPDLIANRSAHYK